MNPEDIKTLLATAFPDANIQVEGDGRHFNLVVVSSQFEGLRTIKRQQMVYAALNAEIASGALHAVNMRTLTPAELAAQA
ncbi:MAG: BolA/IbaG family iron-sulfur metabolism protein [Porticoccaceae bacterium]|nr:BolA/IbaG family iron-sulfur metabolism protein [Porticoccaceae bacterium]